MFSDQAHETFYYSFKIPNWFIFTLFLSLGKINEERAKQFACKKNYEAFQIRCIVDKKNQYFVYCLMPFMNSTRAKSSHGTCDKVGGAKSSYGMSSSKILRINILL